MNFTDLARFRWLLGTLLIAAAALFAVGVAAEGDAHHETAARVESGQHSEATEQAEHKEASEPTGEQVFGVNLESAPLVALAVVISLLLAAATWRHDRKPTLLVTAVFAAAFAALDVAELSHQIKASAARVAMIAGLIAVMHAVAALLAEQRRAVA